MTPKSGRVNWRFHAVAILLIGSACGHASQPIRDAHAAIIGSERDVRTKEGAYDGYRVFRLAGVRGCICIKGEGANWASGMERDRINEDARFRAGFESFRARVTSALSSFRSLNESGLGGACQTFGLFLGMNDWREFDGAIAQIGKLLREDALRERIMLCIATSHIEERIASTK